MSASTPERLERLLTLVPWLLAHPGASLDEIAERFDADPAEVSADLDVLGYCGVPGYGGGDLVEVAVVGDRVTVRMADFFRRPLNLTRHEALTLLLAARSLASVPALADSSPLRRATDKLSRALGVPAEPFPVDLTAPGDELLGMLSTAVDRRRVVRLVYRSATDEQDREREVEPWVLVAGQGGWYLRGWCRRACAPRDFRTDRMRQVSLSDESSPQPPASATLAPPSYMPSDDDVRLVLDLTPAAWWVLDAVTVESVEAVGAVEPEKAGEFAEAVEREGPGGTGMPGDTGTPGDTGMPGEPSTPVELRRATIPARSVEWGARLAVALGGTATVVGPPAVVERVGALAQEALRAYG